MPGRTTAAKRYAEAVAAIARQESSWEQWRRDLGLVGEGLQDSELRLMLESPRVNAEQKAALLERAFGGRVAPQVLSLLKVMGKRGRLTLAPDMLKWFDEIADRALGVRRYVVTSATPLTDEQRQRLRSQLGGTTGQLVLTEHVDPAIIGGLIVRHDDMILDFSIKTRLETLRERLN
ncbi:MAG: ATP synthase F1 subunit delta [Chloroflexota bacterium]